MEAAPDPKALIRSAFTEQAVTYSTNASIADPRRVARLVQAVDPAPAARVLEVAAGPGFVALGFAERCAEVIGIDLTPALIARAEQARRERGLANVRFQEADAERIPFGEGEFDVVVCRLAFHHFPNPGLVLREMARVCRPGATVAVEDLVASEHPERAAYQNAFEKLRDPSHARALPMSELLQLGASAGLELESIYTDAMTPAVNEWLANAKTPPDLAAQARAMIERDAAEDLSVTRPFFRDGTLFYTQRMAAVVWRRLLSSSAGAP